MIDCLGYPVEIGIAVMWRVTDTAKAVFNVDNYKEYLSLQCDSALRNIVRIYPYDVAENVDTTGDGIADEGSLRGSSEVVASRIRDEIQCKVKDAGLELTDIDYINAHGTSTPLNERTETAAIKRAFGDHAYKLSISSIKSMIGHLLGAAGGIECIATALAVKNDIMPATINYETPDEELDLDYVPNVARERVINAAISDSLGFGGHNQVL